MITVYRKSLIIPINNDEKSMYNYKDIDWAITENNVAYTITQTITRYDEDSIKASLEIDKTLYRNKAIVIYYTHKANKLEMDLMYDKMARNAFIAAQDAIQTTIFKGYLDDKSNLYLYPYRVYKENQFVDKNITLVPVEFTPPKDTNINVFLSCIPQVKKLADQWRIKQKIVGNPVDPLDSISYLETQVDMLTCIILNNMTNNIQIPDEYLQVLKTAKEYSCIPLKNQKQMIEEMNVDKAKIREIQQEYHRTKSKE